MAQGYQQFSPLAAMSYVQQQGDIGRERGQRSQLNQLASQAYSAPAEQRESLLSQMAGVDAGSAFQAEKQMAYSDERRNTNMVNMAKLLTGAPPEARAGLYRSMVPTLSRFGLSELPQEYNEQTAPIIDKAAQSLVQAYQGGSGNNVQSTYINAQGKRMAIMRDGSQQELGDANQSIRVMEQEGAIPYGVVTSGGVAGQTIPLGGGQMQPAQAGGVSVGTGAGALRMNIEGVDPARQQRMAQTVSMMQQAGYPEEEIGAFIQAQASVPPGAVASQSFGPVRTPTAGEKSAATERAKLQAQQDFLPTELGMRTNAAVDQAVRIDAGKAGVERASAAPGAIATMQASLNSIDELLNSPDLGSIVGLGSMNPLNRIPGTDARGLIARADQVSGQAFLAAFNQLKGGGAITEREGAAATAAMARLDRSQNLSDYKAALNDLKNAITPAISRQRAALSGQQQGQPAGRTIVRTGTSNGRKVIQYSDGSVEYGN